MSSTITGGSTDVESFIGGRSVGSPDTFDNVDPSNGSVLGRIARGGADEIDRAVEAARSSAPAWARTSPEDRSAALSRYAERIADDVEVLARMECEDSGKPLSQARNDAIVCARYFRFYAHVVESYYGSTIPLRDDLHVYTRREPHGVTGHITAWNYPMQLFARTIAPAIVVGNCAVLKPADETPRTAVHLAQLWSGLGLPDGVINVVTGIGDEAGAALSAHPGIDHLAFVGSTRVGSLVAAAAAERVAPVVLELGGKSAHVVFDDADLDRTTRFVAAAILQNAGQTCSAGSRVLVHEKVHGELLERVAERFATVRIGAGVDDPDLGPLISRRQQDRVRHYVDGRRSGTIVYGGAVASPVGLEHGTYFEPTLIDGVDPTESIAQEEVFGPVVTVHRFTEEDEAIALANGTDYALLGAIWTGDLSRAHRLAARIEAGQVYVNTYGAGGGVELPFGGMRRSGYGREKGVEALDGYTATKTVVVQL